MPRNVVAFVAQNENNILRENSLRLMQTLEPLGIAAHVIDLFAPDWNAQLDKLVSEGLLLGWGYAGIGADLSIGERNFWEALNVPFVSVLSDPPCWLLNAHKPVSRNVVLGYVFDEYLDVQRRFVHTPHVCALVPNAVVPNPHRDRTPWRRRSHRMVFVKTGECPTTRRTQWTQFPRRIRVVLEAAADEACRHSPMGLTDLLLDCLKAHGLLLDGRPDVLFALMAELDVYVRAERATRMVRALSRLPAEIVGRGWDHVERDGARATFRPGVDAALLAELMADTQFVVNTTPNFASGLHDRVLLAFAARACAVSDHNDYSRTTLADVPSFFGVEWQNDDLADRLADIWAIKDDLGPSTDAALRLTETVFAPMTLMKAILELSQLAGLTNRPAGEGS